MKIFLLVLPWVLLVISIVILFFVTKNLIYQKKKLKAERLKSLAAEKKVKAMKLNIDRLTDYNSKDQKIKEEAIKNVQDLKKATKDKDIKGKLLQLRLNLTNIYNS